MRAPRCDLLRASSARPPGLALNFRMIYTGLRCRASTAPSDRTPDQKHNDCADYRADKPSALAGPIPPKCLTKVGGDDRPNNPKNRCENEPLRFIRTRHDELSDHTGDEADDDRPDNAHYFVLCRMPADVRNARPSLAFRSVKPSGAQEADPDVLTALERDRTRRNP